MHIHYLRENKLHLNESQMYLNTTCKKDTKYPNLCWPIISLPADTQNAAHKVLTKPIPYHRRHKMHLNMWWPNLNHAIEFLSWQNPSNASQDKNATQHVLNKHILAHKMHVNLCWPNPSNASEDTICISTRVNQTHSMTNAIQCQREHKMYFNMCWPTLSTCVTKPIQSHPRHRM